VGDTQLWAPKLVRDVLILATGLTVLGALASMRNCKTLDLGFHALLLDNVVADDCEPGNVTTQ
jgi:hypothetical protein